MPDATHAPLTPAVFHVLLALSDGAKHGYAVMRQVEEESGLEMGPGTVYGSLGRLVDAGWVEDAGVDETDARRRSLYRMSAEGRRQLEAEVERMKRLTTLARRRGLALGGSR